MPALTREELQARYKPPEHFDEGTALQLLGITDIPPRLVYASLYADRETAEAYQLANLEHYGHPALGLKELPDGTVAGLLDMRPAIAAAERATASRARRDYPYEDGNVLVLGPEVFVSADRSTICWRGVNYRRAEGSLEPGGTDHDEHGKT